jgi:hypothetical protein
VIMAAALAPTTATASPRSTSTRWSPGRRAPWRSTRFVVPRPALRPTRWRGRTAIVGIGHALRQVARRLREALGARRHPGRPGRRRHRSVRGRRPLVLLARVD